MFNSENHKNKQARRCTKKMQISFHMKLMVPVATTLLREEDFSQQEWWAQQCRRTIYKCVIICHVELSRVSYRVRAKTKTLDYIIKGRLLLLHFPIGVFLGNSGPRFSLNELTHLIH